MLIKAMKKKHLKKRLMYTQATTTNEQQTDPKAEDWAS